MSAATVQSVPFVEIVQIHQCLRVEVTELAHLVSKASKDSSLRAEALKRFLALKSIYESHSKAEDEIIFPELQARGLSSDACRELDQQHNRQQDAFIRLEQVLKYWSDDAPELADELRASIVLHLRMEEEELLPLLGTNFQRHELAFLAGKVIGDRSSELMEAIISMLGRNLPPETVQLVIADFKQAANGTNFSHWIEHRNQTAQSSFSGTLVKSKAELHPEVNLGADQNAFSSFTPDGTAFGCAHYQRGLKLWAPCCQKLFPCTRCHDEFVGQSHQMDLSSMKAGWCMQCGAFQTDPSAICANCSAVFGKYTCVQCGIWESNPYIHVYHCPYCDMCRVGSGLGNDFFHCMRCNACVSTKMRYHKCVEGTLDRQCPVCCESLFSTTKPVHYVRCGHLIHRQCFSNYLNHDYRCAICRCSMIDMRNTWKTLADLASTQGGDNSKSSALVQSSRTKCNDCGMASVPVAGCMQKLVASGLVNLQVGEQCESCGSFNTL